MHYSILNSTDTKDILGGRDHGDEAAARTLRDARPIFDGQLRRGPSALVPPLFYFIWKINKIKTNGSDE
jgi:hypothetical protein